MPVLSAASIFFLNFLLRQSFQPTVKRGLYSEGETPSRVVASACTMLIVGYTATISTEAGAGGVIGYLTADTLAAILYGPWLGSMMFFHHIVSAAAAGASLYFIAQPGLHDLVDRNTRILLFMEAVNAPLHAMWISNKEKSAAHLGLGKHLVPPLAAVTWTMYAYFRVWGSIAAFTNLWMERAAFGGGATGVLSVVGSLGALQIYWFYLLSRILVRAGKEAVSPRSEKLLSE